MTKNFEQTAAQGDTASGVQHTGSSAANVSAKESGVAASGNSSGGGESGAASAHSGKGMQQTSGLAGQSENAGFAERKGTLITGNPDSATAPQAASYGADGMPKAGPVADPSVFDLRLPENMIVNDTMLERYKTFCAECGFTGEQAQRAVDYYMEHQEQVLAAENSTAFDSLRSGVWQGCFDERVAMADHAVDVLDNHMEGRLKPVVAAGLGNNPAFAEAMAVVGELLSEDSFSPHAGRHAETMRPMSTEEFLRKIVFKNID